MKLKIACLFLGFFFISLTAQGRNYYFRHYTNEEGLSHNTVYCSIQDKRGFMWFGTKDGLNRFDGHTFKCYKHEKNDEKSVRSNYITSLHEDADGLIWVGTNTGLCCYDPNTDDFTNLDSLFNHREEIGDLKTDSRGNLWIQTYSGLYRYNKEENLLKFYPSQIYFTPLRICVGSSCETWFTSAEKSIYRYNYKNDTFSKYEVLTPREKSSFSGILSIVDAKEHGLLIGTEIFGLKRFNPNTETVETFLEETGSDNRPILVRTILPFSEDEFYIGTESGLYIFNIRTKEVQNFRKSLNDPYAIRDNAIYSLTKDMEGGVWIGTYFQGLSYLPNEYTPFEKYFDRGNDNCLKGNVVREIVGDKSGNIWIGMEDAGLNKFNPQTGKFTHFSPNSTSGNVSGLNLHGLMVDGNRLWIGYFDHGVDVFDTQSDKIIKRFEAGYKPGDLKTNFVITIFRMPDGKVLLGTISGVYQYNPETGLFSYLSDMAPNSFVYNFCEDHNGTFWISTLNNGLFYKKKDGTTGNYKHNESDPGSISSNAVSNVFEDSQYRLWITTRGEGFGRLDTETGQFKWYTTKNGLPSNFVYKILEDSKGDLWITTSNGLLCFNPETETIKRYSTADGLTNNQFNYNSGYKDKFGKMYFGTINGMIAFVPESFRKSDFNPPVYITGFEVFNEELVPKDEKGSRQSILYADKIELPYDKSTFTIDFAALSFTSPDMNEFRYILDGIDKQWTYLKTHRKAYYTNLPPGEYLFRLKATNGNGEWMEQEKTLRIIIHPPVWRTGWAYLLYFILAGFAVYTVLKFYTQRIKLQNKLKLEKMEDLKQQELLNAKISFFTHIAHEIRTPLTLIKGPLDRIMKSERDASDKESLEIMQKNTNRLLDLTNQLLDFRKAEMEGMKLNFTPVDVAGLLKETYIRFTPVATEKRLSFNLKSEPEEYEAIVDREALTKILSNLFTNALKFAEKEITVSLHAGETDFFEIRVNSDGPLVPAEIKEKIFELFFRAEDYRYGLVTTPKGTGIGLYLGRLLAELHNGVLYLDVTERAFNSFVLRLPKRQEVSVSLKAMPSSSGEEVDENLFPAPENTHTLPVVLLVEDEKEMLDYVTKELSGNYRVLKAVNGKEAMEKLTKNIINLIISDISMPVMDGLEFCRMVKSDVNYSHIPFILLTARQNIQSRIEGLETGADAYISKPFSTDHLLAQISNLLSSREKLLKVFTQTPLVYSNTIASTKADEDFLKMLNDVIMEKISDPGLNVEYLASAAGISVSSLYRKMKGVCDMNPNEFIRLTRLKKAAELLLNDKLSVKEVAYLTGFSAPSYFSSSFLKQFGMKPSEFVKQKKG